MRPEIDRLFNLAAAKDRLRGIEDAVHRSLKYTPRLVKSALVGTAIGLGMLGLAFFAEQRADSNPQIPQLYDRVRISEGNRFIIDHAPFAVAGFAIFGVILGLAAPWINRKVEEIQNR